MNQISLNDCVQMVGLSDSELHQIEGGMEPLTIAFGLAALSATLINMIEKNPDSYTFLVDWEWPDFSSWGNIRDGE